MDARCPLVPSLSLLLLLAAGCAPAPSDGAAGDDPQGEALVALEAETGAAWTVRYHSDVRTPAFLEGRTVAMARDPARAATAARGFVNAHRTLFRFSGHDELRAEDSRTDELGMIHTRLTQHQGGVPVWGGGLTAHFDRAGALTRIHGRYIPLPPIDLVPAVFAADAKRAAIASAVNGREPLAGEALQGARATLVIDPGRWRGAWPGTAADEAPRLAWRVDLTIDDPAAPARRELFVDAASGRVYRNEDLLDDLTGSGVGVFGDRKALQIGARSGRFYLEEARPGLSTQKTYSASFGGRLPGSQVASDRADRFDDSGPASGAAVDAHAHVTATRDYFARVHGLAGFAAIATVHFGNHYRNAYWNGRQLVFGDGDGRTFLPFAGALDVVAHEYTHGLIEFTAGLGRSGEGGALNEAIADLFGCFTELSVRRGGGNFQIGEAIFRPGPAMRDLTDPHRTHQPAHTVEQVRTTRDRGGVHANAAIPAHAGFLMAMGGRNPTSGTVVQGVGVAAAERIWLRALVRYLGPASDFRDAADATVAAARDLYGEGAVTASVVRAWQAVGVLW